MGKYKKRLAVGIIFAAMRICSAIAIDADTMDFSHRMQRRDANTGGSGLPNSLPFTPECRVPLPQFAVEAPPSSNHPSIQAATRSLDDIMNTSFNQSGLDSVAISVVTSEGIVYEGYWGVLRANETDESKRGSVDRQSIYRLGSVSKLFTAFETLILRDRGVLNLDDPVTNIFPNVSYTPNNDPITLRALASHMSGIGRDWPPGSAVGNWPQSRNGSGPPGYSGIPIADAEALMRGIAENPLITPPYTFPIYSNTGYGLLGLANVAANMAKDGQDAPGTHAELLQRDIFGPLGLNASFFVANEMNRQHVVVPSNFTEETDANFGPAMDPQGGQFGSTADMAKVLQALIDPTRPGAPLGPYTVREWLRPLHAWWDSFSQVGMPWEILRANNSYGRPVPLYTKGGSLTAYNAMLTVIPSNSFGVSVLTNGPNQLALPLNNIVLSQFLPVFDSIAEELTQQRLVGNWSSSDSQVEISLEIDTGSLFASRYMVNGTDVLKTISLDGTSRKTPLWSTNTTDYRLAVTMPNSGCFYTWSTLDSYAYERGFATNLIRLTEVDGEWRLQLPATAVELRRPNVTTRA